MSKSGTQPRPSVATRLPGHAYAAPARARAARRRLPAAGTWFVVSLTLLDLIMLALALVLADLVARPPSTAAGLPEIGVWRNGLTLGTTAVITLSIFVLGGLYPRGRRVSRFDEFASICTHLSFSLVLALAANMILLGERALASRRLLIVAWLLSLVMVSAGRLAHTALVGHLRRRGIGVDRLLIVGTGPTAQIVSEKVRRTPALGYHQIGFLAHASTHTRTHAQTQATRTPPRALNGLPIYGTTTRLAEVVRRHEIDEVILALEGVDRQELFNVVSGVRDLPVEIKVYPDSFRIITNNELTVGDLDGLPMISVRTARTRALSRATKRATDLIVGSLALLLLSPLMVVLAVLIKLDSPGPIFYIQERVGLDGVPFRMLKFRSMRADAESRTGPVFASRHDRRVTRVGRVMRRYSLDELPQLINVLRGEMSIVGPRPERPHFVRQFSRDIPHYMRRHSEKAGITGWAQVNGLRGRTSIEERTRYDLYYVENWSLLLDIKIMLKTLFHIFHDDNAY